MLINLEAEHAQNLARAAFATAAFATAAFATTALAASAFAASAFAASAFAASALATAAFATAAFASTLNGGPLTLPSCACHPAWGLGVSWNHRGSLPQFFLTLRRLPPFITPNSATILYSIYLEKKSF